MPDYDSGWALANTVTLTLVLGVVAAWSWRRDGVVRGLRWTGAALVPMALYFLGLLRMFWLIAVELSRFFTDLVWRPSSWLGLGLLGLAVALIVLPARMARAFGTTEPGRAGRQPTRSDDRNSSSASPGPTPGRTEADGSDIADIEAILKRRGIT